MSQRQQAIEELLHPLSESLTQYQRGLHQMEVARQGAYEGLTEKVAQLHQGHEQLQRETHNLVTALRSPQTRGRWGEMQLRRVAEMSGMVAHCDFEEQVTTTSDDRRLRPDMVVHVPGGGAVVVDSKVPLDAFLEMLDADDDAARAACQTRHAWIVRTHIDQLASKEYWKQFASSPQMVVAFIPGDQLLAAAFDADPGIQEYAMSRWGAAHHAGDPDRLAADGRAELAAGDVGRQRALRCRSWAPSSTSGCAPWAGTCRRCSAA